MIYKGKYVEGYIDFLNSKETPRYMRGNVYSIDIEDGKLVVEVNCNDDYRGYHRVYMRTGDARYPMKSLSGLNSETDKDWDKQSNKSMEVGLNYIEELALRELLDLHPGRLVSFVEINTYDKNTEFEPYIIDKQYTDITKEYDGAGTAHNSVIYRVEEAGKFLVFIKE